MREQNINIKHTNTSKSWLLVSAAPDKQLPLQLTLQQQQILDLWNSKTNVTHLSGQNVKWSCPCG